MGDEQDKPPTPPLAETLVEVKRALGRLASAVLKVHYAQAATHKLTERNTQSLERIERKTGDIDKDVAVLLKKIDDTEDAVDQVREDLTPVHGTKLPSKDLSIEQHVEAAKTWLTVVFPLAWKAVVIVLFLAGWAWHAARWLLHAR